MSRSSSSSEASWQSYVDWTSHCLPDGHNCDKRPVWEPPIFDYSDLIGEVFEKKREAVMSFTRGDVVKTTEIMDKMLDRMLMGTYRDWLDDTCHAMEDLECKSFFGNLYEEVYADWNDDYEEFNKLNVYVKQNKDGTWVAMNCTQYSRWLHGREMRHPAPLESESESDESTSPSSELKIYNMRNEGVGEPKRYVSFLSQDVVEPSAPREHTPGSSAIAQELQNTPVVEIKSNMKQSTTNSIVDHESKTTREAGEVPSHDFKEVQTEVTKRRGLRVWLKAGVEKVKKGKKGKKAGSIS